MNKKASNKKSTFNFEKDKEERDEMYEKRRLGWESLTPLKKTLIMALILSFVLFIAISFYFIVKDASSIPALSLDDYERVLRLLDNESWETDRSNLIKIRKLFPLSDGKAETKRDGDLAILHLSGEPFSEKYVFMLADGRMKEQARELYLYFTESDEGTGRALLLEGPSHSAVLNLAID